MMAEKRANLNKAAAAKEVDMAQFQGLKAFKKAEEENVLEVSTAKGPKAAKTKELKAVSGLGSVQGCLARCSAWQQCRASVGSRS